MNTISVQRDGYLVEVRLQRPEKLNAQTHEMWFELRQVGAELGQDTSIRALVVSGEGRSFSAGLDTAVLSGGSAGSAAPDLEGLSGPPFDAAEALSLQLVNRVVPRADLAVEVDALARRVAARPPLAVSGIKKAVNASMVDSEAGLDAAAEGQIVCLGSDDLREAGTAWLEQRDPNYSGT